MSLTRSLLFPFIKKHKIVIANFLLVAVVSGLIGYIIGFTTDLRYYGWQPQYNGETVTK